MKSTLLLSLGLLVATSVSAQRAGDVPYSQATFEVSASPAKVVLQVITNAGLSGEGRSMTVYGDGRVELKKLYNVKTVLEEHTITVGERGVRDLMRLAVDHGVAEWDNETIHAWMRQKDPSVPVVADGTRVRIALSLERYERGGVEAIPLSVNFSTKSPGRYEEWYPEIKQFAGASQLLTWLSAQWNQVAGDDR